MGGKITNNELLCGNYLCGLENRRGEFVIATSKELSAFGTCTQNCTNTDLNKVGCSEDKITLPSGQQVGHTEICNEICDLWTCEDEATCDGFTYGIYCKRGTAPAYIPPVTICDGKKECTNGEDEANCTVTENTMSSCKHVFTRNLVPIHNYTKCTKVDKSAFSEPLHKFKYCELADVARHQTNCSDPSKNGMTCEINGYKYSISKYLICFDDKVGACDDNIDAKCFTTQSCKVHKHLLCDNKGDCDDFADETHQMCSSKTKTTCSRRVGSEVELPIPISWLIDGVRDCENGVDETEVWPTCGEGRTRRYVSEDSTECENVYICRTGIPGYVELDNLCDGLESCGNENMVCSGSSRSEVLSTSVMTMDMGLTKTLSFCVKGLDSLQQLVNVCVTEAFIFPDEDIFGVNTKTSVTLPIEASTCDNMFGELYVYTSCLGRCMGSICPLRNIPRYEVCPDQFPDRVGTVVNNEYLIFLTKSHGTVYSNRYFVCNDKVKCIDYSKVCDLVHDCMDGSDEAQCTNHFKCETTGKLIPKTSKCNGHIDCADLSDECNVQCSREILEGTFLKGLSWLIGILAIMANLVIVGNSLWTMRCCRTTAALFNRLFIFIIALGDLFVGCYLFTIATYDTIIFKKVYCQKQIFWITSSECTAIGVFSTIGSQLSLFSMTGLSIVRIYGIMNSMKIPGEVTVIVRVKIVTAVLFLVLVSAIIAVAPVIRNFEDFFVNGVKFADGLKIFIGVPDKSMILKVIEAYYGRAKNYDLSWETLIQMVKDMFSHDRDHVDLTERIGRVDFYGNDGVCLFKYFVHEHDPQRLFVWSVLSINFICFLFISTSYLSIGIFSKRSSKNLSCSQNNRQITQRNKRMDRRIAMIISSDFICWVPFIVICILHSLEVIDATPWYGIFSMIILPINSVINPFLYDDVVTISFRKTISSFSRKISRSAVFLGVRDRIGATSASEIELNQLQSPTRAKPENVA